MVLVGRSWRTEFDIYYLFFPLEWCPQGGVVFELAVFPLRFACLGWPPKGSLFFLDKKKQNSRLGSDVGLVRRNLNGGSARARFAL